MGTLCFRGRDLGAGFQLQLLMVDSFSGKCYQEMLAQWALEHGPKNEQIFC